MQTTERLRIEQVVDFAMTSLPLIAIADRATFPDRPKALWLAYADLSCILQALPRFPGIGWPLLHAGICSADDENRHWALDALCHWPQATWPTDARAILTEARRLEPERKLQRGIKRVLAGKTLDLD